MLELLTPAEAADLLRLPVRTLAEWRQNARGPRFVRLGRHVRYDRTELVAWVAERAQGGER